MSEQLHVIALISGGKDSFYSILHCLKHGHKVVALANLYPPPINRDPANEGQEGEGDDLDSFMYQTIGHSIIPLYESALGIPLYRQEICGKAVNTARDYSYQNHPDSDDDRGNEVVESSSSAGNEDEAESIYHLLRRVMRDYPDANAVCAGAVLSTYQRTRIENIAFRLNLVSLAWLWMYPYLPPPAERTSTSTSTTSSASEPVPSVTGLLEDMANCGCEARIIKVASGGLDSDDLWKNVSSSDPAVRSSMVKKLGRFLDGGIEGAVLGEGGEYESLALDGPRVLWKGKIEVDDVERRVGEAGVGFLDFRGARCVEKLEDGRGDGQNGGLERVGAPVMFDSGFGKIRDDILQAGVGPTGGMEGVGQQVSRQGDGTCLKAHSAVCGNTLAISNVTAPEAGKSAVAQMEGIKTNLTAAMRSENGSNGKPPSMDDVIFVTITLRSMADFASINATYSSLFTKPNPPARATIACGDALPAGVELAVSAIFDLGPRDCRNGLHVQSRSYWAPANIGPYSQAICVPPRKGARTDQAGGLVYIAGQIPLDPASMKLAFPGEEFVSQAVLSLQHLWRVGRVMEVDWWLGSIAYISGGDSRSKAAAAWSAWEMANADHSSDEDEDNEDTPEFDAWDIKYGRQVDPAHTRLNIRDLPRFEAVRGTPFIPAFFAVEVEELPRGSDIEWQGFGTRTEIITMKEVKDENISIQHVEGPGFGSYTSIGITAGQNDDVAALVNKAMDITARKLLENGIIGHSVIYTPYTGSFEGWKGQVFPCTSVYGPRGEELSAALTIHIRPT